MTFDLGILLGLIAIAVAVYFGLREFRKDTSEKLSDIRECVCTSTDFESVALYPFGPTPRKR